MGLHTANEEAVELGLKHLKGGGGAIPEEGSIGQIRRQQSWVSNLSQRGL